MEHFKISVNNIYVVGCGGVASWLLPPLLRLLRHQEPLPFVTLLDGDKFEEGNIDRQLFNHNYIGTNKATSLSDLYDDLYYNLDSEETFLTEGTDITPNSLLLGCADNHAARRTILYLCDRHNCRAIIGGNEYTDADAYFYEPALKDTPLDPRVYFPDILTDETGDPTRPRSCQGIAQEQTPQLVLANFSAANSMLWLLWFHYVERLRMPKSETYNFWPMRHFNSFSRFGTDLVKDRMAAPLPTRKQQQ